MYRSLTALQGLSLNPVTMSPEVMLSLARVVALKGDIVVIRHLEKPAGDAAYAFGIAVEDESGEEEDVAWSAIQALPETDSWRVI